MKRPNVFIRRQGQKCIRALALGLSVCLLALGGCAGRTTSGMASAPEPAPPAVRTEFTQQEFLADYDQVWAALEEDYLYFDLLEERYGLDIPLMKESCREMLLARVTTVGQFYGLLKNMFTRMYGFAHLGILDPGFHAQLCWSFNEGEPWASDPQGAPGARS